MAAFETRSRVGPDGTLHLTVPASLAGKDVHVIVERAETANGYMAGDRPPMSPDQWREFIRSTAGSMPDLPDVERPGPSDYEKRDY